jgi:hypothetical protein
LNYWGPLCIPLDWEILTSSLHVVLLAQGLTKRIIQDIILEQENYFKENL